MITFLALRLANNATIAIRDPFLSGTYAYEMIGGMQTLDSHGWPKMSAFLKHFTACESQPTGRAACPLLSSKPA